MYVAFKKTENRLCYCHYYLMYPILAVVQHLVHVTHTLLQSIVSSLLQPSQLLLVHTPTALITPLLPLFKFL
jgi:hypothetical protein